MQAHHNNLNFKAFKNDIRKMKSYFQDFINLNSEVTQIRFVNTQGHDVIREFSLGKKNYKNNLSNSEKINEMLELEFGDYQTTQDKRNGTIENIVWWIPVFTSPGEKYGVISFSINYEYILDIVGQLVTFEVEEVCLNDEDGKVLLSIKNSKSCFTEDDRLWTVTDNIRLPGLSWVLSLSTNPDGFLVEVQKIKTLVFTVIFPIVAVFAFIMAFIFLKQSKSGY